MTIKQLLKVNGENLTDAHRETLYRRMCFLMTGRNAMIPRCWLCDPFDDLLGIRYNIMPIKVEKYMKRRGKLVREGESIADAVIREYDKETCEIMRKLI